MTGSTQETSHLLTDRLDLRALTASDLDPLHRIISDPRNCVHIPEGPMKSLDDSRAWVERFGGRWDAIGLGYWTVRLRATGTVIGVGGADRRLEFWNLFYFLGRDHWGSGYGSEVAAAARDAVRARDPGLPLVAWIHRGNAASQAVARRLGLRDYGQRETRHWRGQPMHCWADREPGPGQPRG